MIYERELKFLDQSKVIKELVAKKKTANDDEWWELDVYLKNKEDEALMVITIRNTPRRWVRLNSLYTFIEKTCPSLSYFKVTMIKTNEESPPNKEDKRKETA